MRYNLQWSMRFVRLPQQLRTIGALWRSENQYSPSVGIVNKNFSENFVSLFRAKVVRLRAMKASLILKSLGLPFVVYQTDILAAWT
jgi:hypothetical protein